MKIMMYMPGGMRSVQSIGGVQTSTRRMMEALHQRGIECNLMMLGYPGPLSGWVANYPVYFITPNREPRWNRPRTLASVVRSVLQIHLAMRRARCDILHVQGAWTHVLPPALASMLPRRWKTVVTLRGSDIRVKAVEDKEHRRWLGILLRHANAVSAISRDLADTARRVYGKGIGMVQVIPEAVDPHWFEPACEVVREEYVVFVGRLHVVKGVDYLLSAWELLQKAGEVRAELWIVGDGPERQSLERFVQEKRLTDSVRFWGAIDQKEQLKSLYAGARALVLPSRSEGLANVLLEAGACGTICIGANIGGIPDVIVHEETGFLFPPGDVEVLAQTILRVLNMSDSERKNMSSRARERMRTHFSLDRALEQWISFYQRVLEGG